MIDHIGLTVADLDKARAFYLAALVLAGGLDPREPFAFNAFGYDFLCDTRPAAG